MFLIKNLFTLAVAHISLANEVNDDFFTISKQIPQAIDHVEGDRCFIKPDKIVLLEGEVYVVNDGGGLVSFPMVCFSRSGAYLPLSASPRPSPIWICSKCTLAHYYPPTICERRGCEGVHFIVRYR